MKTLYFDCFSGISGDMALGALLDLGVELEKLRQELNKIGLVGLAITTTETFKKGIRGCKANVRYSGPAQPHRSYKDICSLLDRSLLSPKVKETSLKVFDLLARAEGGIHGKPPEEVHFHEVGAADSLADIVGCAVALEMLGIEKITASPLPVCRGFVEAAHGLLPLPAPAALEICLQKNIPLAAPPLEVKEELVTPTGAALLGALVAEFSPTPSGTPLAVGYGAGDNDFPFPNLLRLLLFQEDNGGDKALNVLIEANIDDMNPEIYGFLMEELFLIGALDVYFTPVQMKKNRPGIKISVLASLEKASLIREFVLTQTTTLGVREIQVAKYCAKRIIEKVGTPWGKVRVKISFLNGKVANQAPEYEDCLKISRRHGIPLKDVFQKVISCLEADN